MVVFLQLCLFLVAVLCRGSFLLGYHLRASSVNSQTLTYTATGYNRYRIVGRHIGIKQKNGIPFIIKPERWYHQVLKSIGIASEIKIKDSEFDKKYFIATDYPDHLEQGLISGKLLSHLQELFALPVESLHATPQRIWCVIKKMILTHLIATMQDISNYSWRFQRLAMDCQVMNLVQLSLGN